MPFKSSKRAKNKEYYKLHATDLKESAKKKYSLDREHFIYKSMRHNESAASVNIARVKKSVAKRVKEHYSRNADTSTASIKGRVSKHRQQNVQKAKENTRQNVFKLRQRDPLQARMNTQLYVAHFRVKNPVKSATCLIKHFQDTFSADIKIVSKLMKALKKVQTDLQPKCRPSTQYAACKLASSHLVRFALQIRRKAVGSLLGIKKNIMELQLYNESDLGQRQHTESREPYFADAAYYVKADVPSRIVVQADGQCRLSDVKYSKYPQQKSCNTGKETKEVLYWECSSRCKPVSVQDIVDTKLRKHNRDEKLSGRVRSVPSHTHLQTRVALPNQPCAGL